MLPLADRIRDLLVPLLAAGLAVLAALLLILLAQRGVRAMAQAIHRAHLRRLRPLIGDVLSGATPVTPTTARQFGRYPSALAELLLDRLRIVRGAQADRARALADAAGLSARWRKDLESPRWWTAANAALAIGLVGDRQAVGPLVTLLDHDHDQVRAAAIDALGAIADESALPALVVRLKDPARHEFARLVQALTHFGDRATSALVDAAASATEYRAGIAAVIGHLGGAAAAEPLLQWTRDDDARVRAAAWKALSEIGLTDRAFYHGLRALGDENVAVRAAATRAIGRAARVDAAPHLAPRLDDQWDVAAQAARALRRMGPAGEALLQARADGGEGLGQDLARQMLWEAVVRP